MNLVVDLVVDLGVVIEVVVSSRPLQLIQIYAGDKEEDLYIEGRLEGDKRSVREYKEGKRIGGEVEDRRRIRG